MIHLFLVLHLTAPASFLLPVLNLSAPRGSRKNFSQKEELKCVLISISGRWTVKTLLKVTRQAHLSIIFVIRVFVFNSNSVSFIYVDEGGNNDVVTHCYSSYIKMVPR